MSAADKQDNQQRSEILIYQNPDGRIKLDVLLEQETVWLTQEQMAELFGKARSTINEHIKNTFSEVDARTIEWYLEKYGDELGRNGYEVLRGNRLKTFKKTVNDQFVPDIHVGSKTTPAWYL